MEGLRHNFWGLTASALGTYECLAFLTRKRVPTVSTYCARRKATRALITGWAVGLAVHLWKHTIDD